jgi:membrane protease YdiL (CAAX protease family)
MNVSSSTRIPIPPSSTTDAGVEIPQLTRPAVLAVWAAAAVPMAALSWLVAPAIDGWFAGEGTVPLVKALLACLTVGLAWQFVLVAMLLRHEQRDLRWSTVRDALWLTSPRSPRSGRSGGRVWLVVLPLLVAFYAAMFIPGLPVPGDRDFSRFLESDAGQVFFDGNWTWYAVLVVMWTFNTVLGEELLFRGYLLPRMNGAFGRGDWLVNGILFAGYHLHTPWVMPAALADAFVLSYPTKRYRSAWLGIAVHSAQSVFLAVVLLTLVV